MKKPIEFLTIKENDPVFGGNQVFDLFKYSAATKANGFVFISGQVGIAADGSIPTSIAEQTRTAFLRLEQILRYQNLDFSDIVELVSYHTDPDAHLDIFREVKDEFLVDHRPAWSIIGVNRLAREDFIVEIKAIAIASE